MRHLRVLSFSSTSWANASMSRFRVCSCKAYLLNFSLKLTHVQLCRFVARLVLRLTNILQASLCQLLFILPGLPSICYDHSHSWLQYVVHDSRVSAPETRDNQPKLHVTVRVLYVCMHEHVMCTFVCVLVKFQPAVTT